MKKRRICLHLCALVALLVLLPSVRGTTPEEAFAAPPPEAHVGVWWHWMGGQVSREGVEKDLDWFVRMGITSATVFGMADCTMPWARRIGNVPTGIHPYDETWWKLLKFVCAEGKRIHKLPCAARHTDVVPVGVGRGGVTVAHIPTGSRRA